ncbi:MAG: hypothetical protein KJS64_01815 [Acidobacteria bacterium]|nr:hypothetical protein [Acidobacteriota bacterium]
MDLEDQFAIACQAAIAECGKLSPPYVPTAWIGMINRLGAVEAARQLVMSADIQPGFVRLVASNRADLTIESAILDDKWEILFDEDMRSVARWRLQQAGVQLP